ncbi:MAG TPA: AAA family ATPase [Candidatus Dormibacteraeota bacterium]|nr:AAA family ATPase [Candidatus Dormibacteraeota bacterium]
MSELIDLGTARAGQARLSKAIGRTGYRILMVSGSMAAAAAVALGLTSGPRYLLLLAALALVCYLPAVWWKRQLAVLPPTGNDLSGRLSVDVLARLKPGMIQQPQSVWAALSDHWQAVFFLNHLLITKEVVAGQLSAEPAELGQALQFAIQLADQNKSPIIELGFVVAGLLLASPGMKQTLTQLKIQAGDVEALANWLGRNVVETPGTEHHYGGIGRDWAFGYTPLLDRFGHNLSLGIAEHGAHFGWVANSDGVLAIEAAFDNHASAVALIGPDGIGKSTSVQALAERLIEGETGPTLAYHQVIALNATDITANAKQARDLEQIMLSLANEAAHAGHVILFFDDAQMFFNEGPGAFDASQILLSIIQAKSVPIILAMSPDDHQRLKAKNHSLAGLLTPVMLQELPEGGVMRVLEDTAAGLENRHHVLIAYEALREAYRLSGRYEQDEAYPGKAIKLLEQAITHSDNSLVNAASVQQAIEQTRGVKAGNAAPVEADALLHLEDNIHRRMINQAHAVKVVANALRRARAGVANPRRPIGSFLFLGPTGVGKTELAKSIAATYFGAESNMVRLDMSEYQQAEDVSRLLSDGQQESKSLIMSVREQPFSVVLLDEIEKAHPNILNLLLQLLDEGQLTDTGGKTVSFKDCIIISTSNAGANTIRERVGKGESLESFQAEFTDELINSGQFKPELLNRFDEMVLFRPLQPDELVQVVQLMVAEVNETLANQNIALELTPAAIQKIVEQGNDPRLGARPMRRVLQRAVEDTVAQKILKGEAKPGDKLTLDAPDLVI